MSSILNEVAVFTDSVVVPDPGEKVNAADVEAAVQPVANRTRLFELMRVTNWDRGRQMSANAYEPIDMGYDPQTRRWYVLHNDPSAGPPTEYAVSSSADGVTWDVEEHLISSGTLFALCTESELDDSVLAGGNNGLTQRVSATGTWTDRTLANVAVVWDIAWDPANELFIAVGSTTTPAPGVWTSPDGTTWTQRAIAASGANYVDGVVVSSTGHAVAWSDGSTQYWTSDDGGVTWTARGAPPVAGTVADIVQDVAVTEGGATWMMTSGGTFFVSTDNGLNWTATGVPDVRPDFAADNFISSLVGIGSKTIVAVAPAIDTLDTEESRGEVFYTLDGGTTWYMAAGALDRVKLNWPGSFRSRGQLYRSALGQLALLGCESTSAAALHLFRGLALGGVEATA